MEITWDIEPDKMLEQAVAHYLAAIRRGLVAIAKRRADEITTDMQESHRWQNQTGEAESRLLATVEEVEEELIEILLQHGAAHGWWLEGYDPRDLPALRETMLAGKFAILAPSVDKWSPVIFQDIVKLVRG